LLDLKLNVAMMVSRANETSLSLNHAQANIAVNNLLMDLSGGESGLTLADLQVAADK